MKKCIVLFVAVFLVGFGVTRASAAEISLYDYAFNIDGVVTSQSCPAGVNCSAFDAVTGLGTISFTISGPGTHSSLLFVDHEIDELVNTFFNEYGAAPVSPLAGQSWEIDEPGYAFGNIYNNFHAGALDNSNGVPLSAPDDVSMALGWNFNLAAGETATISFFLGTDIPGSGFYLAQTDDDSVASIYLSSTLDIGGGGTPVPEPGTFMLLACGLVGLVGWRRRRK